MGALDFQQSQIQSQLQIMSQKQIQSLELLSLASVDLREAVYKAAQENPALEITKDSLAQGQKGTYSSRRTNDFTHTSSSTSAAAREASDNFQAALEAKADDRQSLQEHLLMQLHLLHLKQSEEELGEKLIKFGKPVSVIGDVSNGVREALTLAEELGAMICSAGSLYICGEVRACFCLK